MTMSEFKDLVKDVGLETKDLKFDVMQTCSRRRTRSTTNAVARAAQGREGHRRREARGRRARSRRSSQTRNKREEAAARSATRDGPGARALRVRRGAHPHRLLARQPVPRHPQARDEARAAARLPPPDAARGRAAERQARRLGALQGALAGDKAMQAALARTRRSSRSGSTCTRSRCSCAARGASCSTSSGRTCSRRAGAPMARARRGYTPGNGVGNWEIYQDSEITGDERCRNIFKVSLSLPQAKFAFINSQSLDQLTVGQAKDTDAMTTLEFDEFKECIARCALDKYKPIKPDVGRGDDHLLLQEPARRGEHRGVHEHGDAHQGRALQLEALLADAAGPERSRSTRSGSRCGSASSSPTCTTSRCGRRACTTCCRSTSPSSRSSSSPTAARCSARTRPRTRWRWRWPSSRTLSTSAASRPRRSTST